MLLLILGGPSGPAPAGSAPPNSAVATNLAPKASASNLTPPKRR